MSSDELSRLLRIVGQRVFVTYYRDFEDVTLDTADVAGILAAEGFTEKACRSRATHARRIFQQGFQIEALKAIASSTRAGNEKTARMARDLLAEQQKGTDLVRVDAAEVGTLTSVTSEALRAANAQGEEPVSIVLLPATAAIDETRLAEITDTTVIARVTQGIPKLVETVARTRTHNALKDMEVYRAILKDGETLAKSKAMEGMYRGFGRAGDDFSSHFSSQANFAKVDPSEALASYHAALANVMNVASLVVGQYYMSQVNSRLEALSASVNSLGDFNEAELKSRIVSLISHVGEISQFSSRILEDEDLRRTKQQTLDHLRRDATDLLGQVNEMIDTATSGSRKPNPSLSDYQDRIRRVAVLLGYQHALLAILSEISELTYLIGKGTIPSDMSHFQFDRYLQQCVQTNTRLGEWHNRQVARLNIDLDQGRRDKLGRYRTAVEFALDLGAIDRTPPAPVGYTRLKQGIARQIRIQSRLVLDGKVELKDVYGEDVEIIVKDGKFHFYLPERQMTAKGA